MLRYVLLLSVALTCLTGAAGAEKKKKKKKEKTAAERSRVNAHGKVQVYGVHKRVAKNDAAGVRKLLKEGADINDRTNGVLKQSPLMLAVMMNKPEMVELLLDLGADAALPMENGYLPVHGAATSGHIDALRALYEAGEDLHVPALSDGQYPLHLAAAGGTAGHAACLRFLVEEARVPIDAKNADGVTFFKGIDGQDKDSVVGDAIIDLYTRYVKGRHDEHGNEL